MRVQLLLFAVALLLSLPSATTAQKASNYRAYHQEIIQAEELIAQQQYAAALAQLEHTFSSYGYVFLRDYQVAIQLALRLQDKRKAFHLLESSIAAGWTLSAMKKSPLLPPLRDTKCDWQHFQTRYPALRRTYEQRLNQPLRAEVQAMGRKDQQLALTNLLQLGKRAQERFLRKKFAPHSARQVARLAQMLREQGYPGEQLIGNGSWMARIISHHNSISVAHTQADTLYPQLQPALMSALQRGELAPAEYATFDDWYVASKSDRREEAYGYLNPLTEQELPLANARRARIGLRSVELRNQLVSIQEQTGLNLLVDGTFWVKGKIQIVRKR